MTPVLKRGIPWSEESGWSYFSHSVSLVSPQRGVRSSGPRGTSGVETQTRDDRLTASTWDPLVSCDPAQLHLGPVLLRPTLRFESQNETSVSPSFPFPHPITTSNMIRHHISVAARFGEQTGKLIIIVVSGHRMQSEFSVEANTNTNKPYLSS